MNPVFRNTLITILLVNCFSKPLKEVIDTIRSKVTFAFNDSIGPESIRPNRPVVRIVTFDRIKGYLNWHQEWFVEAAETRCSTKCIITDEKTYIDSADIILFHAPTHGRETLRFPVKKPSGALYILISMEQPMYATLLKDTVGLSKNFDILATYSLASTYSGTNIPNIPMTYFPLNILAVEAVLHPPRPFGKKTGYGTNVMVAAFVSNCKAAGALKRFAYLEELMAHIKVCTILSSFASYNFTVLLGRPLLGPVPPFSWEQVHSYGGCLKNRDEPNLPEDPLWPVVAQRRARKIKVLSRYKFYLAFENLPVPDYVSEKAFEGYFAGTVPVYRGTETIEKFLPSNDSFINANDLTPSELAQLLKRIGSDESLYNKYFQFKNKPLSNRFVQVAEMSYSHPNAACRLCEAAILHRELV